MAVPHLIGRDSFAERRISPRVDVRVRALFRSTEGSCEAWVENLSQTGLYMSAQISTQLPIGAEGLVSLRVAGHDVVDLPATVVWNQPGAGVGLIFGSLDRERRLAIANIIVQQIYGR